MKYMCSGILQWFILGTLTCFGFHKLVLFLAEKKDILSITVGLLCSVFVATCPKSMIYGLLTDTHCYLGDDNLKDEYSFDGLHQICSHDVMPIIPSYSISSFN